jgi:hypothetical protein
MRKVLLLLAAAALAAAWSSPSLAHVTREEVLAKTERHYAGPGAQARAYAAINWLKDTRCIEPEDAGDVEAIVADIRDELERTIRYDEKQLQAGGLLLASHARGRELAEEISKDERLIHQLDDALDGFKKNCPPPNPFEEATISIGGGPSFLTLPDTKFTRIENFRTGEIEKKQNNLGFDQYGGGVNGSLELPFADRWRVDMYGGYTSIHSDKTTRCEANGTAICVSSSVVDDPLAPFVAADFLKTQASKNVNLWGANISVKRNTQAYLVPLLVAAGFDVRGIDQDLDIKGDGQVSAAPDFSQIFKYTESLDTTYYGGFVGVSGELPFGIPGTQGLWEKLGLRTFFGLKAGVYDAHTDYDGTNRVFFKSPLISIEDTAKLGLSDDKAAFIGTLEFETVKQLGPRTSLSWLSQYEWWSYVPNMRYNDSVHPTDIGSSDAFFWQGSLRLNIGLGPDRLYEDRVPTM